MNQYDNPIDCYSEETIEDMTGTSSTWKKTDDQVSTTEKLFRLKAFKTLFSVFRLPPYLVTFKSSILPNQMYSQ